MTEPTGYQPQDLLIVEDLMLLLLDDEKGNVAGETVLTYLLGGAVLVELTLLGRSDQDEKKNLLTGRKVLATGTGALPDPLLQAAWEQIAEKPRGARSVLEKIGKGLNRAVPGRLIERGLVREEKKRFLGVIPRTLHPAVDGTREAELRREIRAVLAEGAPADPRIAALIALLSGSNTLRGVVKQLEPPLSWSSEVKRRAKEIQEGDWGAGAVSDAVAAAAAAVAGGAAAAAGAAAATS